MKKGKKGRRDGVKLTIKDLTHFKIRIKGSYALNLKFNTKKIIVYW